MDEATQRRIAVNESRYRAINERQVDATTEFRATEVGDSFTIICECSIEGCESMLEVEPDVYRDVRSHGARFLVMPEHVVEPAPERIVEEKASYWIIEKVGESARIVQERA